MNAYDIADQIINGSIDTNFDEPEIDVKGLKDDGVDEDVVTEQEEIKAAAQKIAAILAGAKKVKKVKKTTPKLEVKVKSAPAAKTVVSKMDTAREMYNSAEDKSRKNILNMFTTQLGMSTAMASTYYYKIR